MEIQILNNACFLIKTEHSCLLVDPCLSKQQVLQLNPTAVLVSHGHLDHATHLKHVTAPIYGNRYVSVFKPTDVNIEEKQSIEINDILIAKIPTFKHPRWFQKNFLYDLLLYPSSKIIRCGVNTGFVFQCEGKTIYYTSDTLWKREIFEQVQKEFLPDLILYCSQSSWLFPKLLMTNREAKQLQHIFSGKLVQVHQTLKTPYSIWI